MTVKNSRHFLTLADWSVEELEQIVKLAAQLKSYPQHLLQGKILGLFFDGLSTRTRISFEVGMYQLGGHTIKLVPQELQLAKGESISDTARVLSGYLDALVVRTPDHRFLQNLTEYSSIPIINGLSNMYHPCQALSDFFTICEHVQQFHGVKLAYLGDCNNVLNSLLWMVAHFGLHLVVASPFDIKLSFLEQESIDALCEKTGASITLTQDPVQAVYEADFIYTDTWHSLGDSNLSEDKAQRLKPYQVNKQLVSYAKENYYFMHCLPAHREQEVTEDIIENSHSIVFEQAKNRLYIQQALLVYLLR